PHAPMSYLALARKWRPRRFEDVLGQSHVVQALSHALAADKLHPAILLTGTRGVGKTTVARLIAKGLNCETGVSASPCGRCTVCQQIDEGRFVDLLEIDAASHTGVDNVREVIDNAQYAPVQGRYKTYLIDEVHMLSKSAFNALLKTLEEPPPRVKFILATTDPQRLPVTVLSRCLQFNLRRLPAALIRERLTTVLEQEGFSAEPAAVAELARNADGSMRDGLSLLDQAIAFCGGRELKRGPVEEMLGTHGRQTLFEILRAVAAGDGPAALQGVERLDTQVPDYFALLADLAAALQRIAVLQVLPKTAEEDDDPALQELAHGLPAEDVQLYYQIVVNGRRDFPWVPDPRLGFEMTVLRLLAFQPGTAAGLPAVSPAGASASSKSGGALPHAAVAPETDWCERVNTLGLDGFAKQLARHCEWLEKRDATVRLGLASPMKHLLQEDRRVAIEQALARQLQEPLRVAIEISNGGQTPAQMEERRHAEGQRHAEAAIEADPAIRALREKLGATVRAGSVQIINDGSGK
ncbi:MAG: DNA polymerase III subunit gamma/tau, partial [Nevskiales bacterium]|nr:DNA polymerase III subunit gamma/tau [Nevskiales bacterium]